MSSIGATDINELFRTLPKAVFIPMPLGSKGPKEKGWNQVTWEEAQTVTYKRKIMDAVERGGNIGILLGPESGDLVAIDLDDDEDAERFFRLLPWARDTMVTRGRHFQVWFYMTHDGYPAKRMVLKESSPGKPTVEFRGGGGIQSVVFGPHPDDATIRYSWNGKIPKHIDYVDLQLWLATLSGQKSLEKEHPGQNLDHTWLKKFGGSDIRNLDLVGLLQAQGIKLRKIDEITWAIPCPWKYNHTTGNGERDAAIIQHPPGRFFPAFHCFHAHCSELGLPDLLDLLEVSPEELKKWCRPSKQKIQLVAESAEGVLDEIVELPKVLVDGLIFAGSKVLISAPPKVGKTWMGLDLAICLATANKWLGFDISQKIRVLYLNMEMRGPFFKKRAQFLMHARHIREIGSNLWWMHLRGTPGAHALAENLDPLIEHCKSVEPYELIVLDPMYKFLGKRDENSVTEVADMLANIDTLIDVTGAATVSIHHTSKGRQDLKAIVDRASGSSAFVRDPDAYISIIRAGEGCKLDFEMREVPSIPSFGIRWNNYLWERDANIDVDQAAIKKDKPPTSADLMWGILKQYPEGLTWKEWQNLCVPKIKEDTFNKVLQRGTLATKIEQRGDRYHSKVL